MAKFLRKHRGGIVIGPTKKSCWDSYDPSFALLALPHISHLREAVCVWPSQIILVSIIGPVKSNQQRWREWKFCIGKSDGAAVPLMYSVVLLTCRRCPVSGLGSCLIIIHRLEGKWRGFYNPGNQLPVHQSCIAPGLVLQYSSSKHRERGQVHPANGTSGLSRLSFVEENTCLSIATPTQPLGNIELSKM